MPDLRDALHKRDQSKLEHLGRFNRVQNSLFELTFLTLYIRFLMKQIYLVFIRCYRPFFLLDNDVNMKHFIAIFFHPNISK